MASPTESNSSPSDKSSDSGSGQPWGSTGGSLDSEEEEIVAEIREVWRMSTVSYSVNEDSTDSIDAEEVAQIKEKLRALRQYVSELQASYDELLSLFSQHESSASECRSNLEKKLEDALNQAKFYQQQCQLLENELSALQQQDTSGSQPAAPKSPLRKKLADDLENISSGLQTKMNRLSQLTHTSRSPTGQRSPSEKNSPTSEGSEEDEDPLPKQARQYTVNKVAAGSTDTQQQGEGEALQTSIGSWDLEGIDEDSVLGQLLEKECQVTLLQTRVQDLEHQLQEAQRDHRLMATSLSATQLELQDQSVNEKETTVKMELADLRAERDRLAVEVKDSYRSVGELTAAKDAAMTSVSDLQQQLDTMKDKLTNQESQTNELHDSLDTRSSDQESSTCEADRASMEEAQQRVCRRCVTVEKTVHTLEDKLRTAEDETQSLQNEVLRKKGEMVRLMSSIQLARAQIGTMHKRLRQSGNDSLDSSKDSEVSSKQLTAAEQASEALEESMTQHMSLWDKLCDSVDSHQTTVSAMQDKHTELVAEIHEREARVLRLEALLQAGDVSNASGTRTLRDLAASVIKLKAELARAKEETLQSQEEYTELLRVLSDSLNVVSADRSMLSAAVNDRDSQLSKVQQDYRELSDLYSSTCAQATAAESAKHLAEQRLREVNSDLCEHSQVMADLEADLLAERKARELDLELTTISLYSLREKLASVVLMNTDGGKAGVQDQLSQRDALLATLQEQTAQLLLQYQQSSQEVDERQQLVQSLETDLLSSQELCDSLQQQISNGQIRASTLKHELTKSESERFQLSEQLQVLQGEAENACSDLERSLRHSKLLSQQSKEHIETLDQQLVAERKVSNHLMEQLHSLKLTQTEGESELEHLRRMMDELRQENDQLHSNNQRQKELIVNLQTRAEMLEGGTTMADRRLREQLTASEEERREAEVTAIQRLDDIIQLKTQLEDANLVITDLKVERLGMVHSSQNSCQRIQELEETLSSLSLQMKQKEEAMFHHRSTGDANSAFIQQKLEECREELHRCQLRATELDMRYQSTLEELAVTRTKLSTGGDLFSVSEEDPSCSVKVLQGRVSNYQRELEEKERKLEKTELERMELLLRIGELNSCAEQSGSDAESSLPPSLTGEVAAASVKVNLPSSYQQTLEKGLVPGSALDTSGYSSPVESPNSLDKAYWVRRAAELSVQLQQSTQYWSSKVRQQELQLHNTSTSSST